jgi:MFS family permease
MGVTIGMLLGTPSMSLMIGLPGDQFLSWGWGVPFLLSVFLVFLGLWIRSGIDEAPVFREARARGQIVEVPLLETVRRQWRQVLVAVGAKVVETAPFYIFSTFIISYGTINLGFDKMETVSPPLRPGYRISLLRVSRSQWQDPAELVFAGVAGFSITRPEDREE